MDFTDINTLVVSLKAKDDERIFYCSWNALKPSESFRFPSGVVELDVKSNALILYLRFLHGDPNVIPNLNIAQKMQLLRTADECAKRLGAGTETIIAAVLQASASLDSWTLVATRHNLDIKLPLDVIKLLCHSDTVKQLPIQNSVACALCRSNPSSPQLQCDLCECCFCGTCARLYMVRMRFDGGSALLCNICRRQYENWKCQWRNKN